MNNLVKSLWLGSLLALGQCLPASASDKSASPLSIQAFDSGTVVIKDNLQEVLHVNPVIFTGNFVEKHWEGYFPFQAGRANELRPGFNAIARVNGVLVDLLYRVETSGSGLHIYYHLVPRESVEVSCVQVYASFPYSDWQGDTYEFNDNEGLIPVDRVTDWAIRQADSAPFSMGPSHTHGGLTVQMTSEGLHLVMADNRDYDPDLCLVYSHNDSKPNWIWEKGENKDFDFTITFNRNFDAHSDAAPPSSSGALTLPVVNGCPTTLIDDFADPGRNIPSPAPPTQTDGVWLSDNTRTNLWDGQWRLKYTNGNSMGVTYSGPGQGSSRYSAGVTGSMMTGNRNETSFALYQSALAGSPSGWINSFNAAGYHFKGIQFWMKGDGQSYWVQLPSKAVTDLDWYSYLVTPKTYWTFYQIPFDEMSRPNFDFRRQYDLPEKFEGTDITAIQFYPKDNNSFAYSLDQISFYGDYVSNCSTPGAGAPTPTITPTPLENDCLDRGIDDFEDPARNGPPPARINRWGGKWNAIASSDSRIIVSYSEPGAQGSRFCASVSGENPLGSKGGDVVFQTPLFANGAPFNTVIHGLTGVQFWMKGDGNSYWFNLLSSSVTDVNGYSFNVVPPKGVWTLFRVPFKEMSLKSWWETEGGAATHPDGSDITGVGFESKGRGSFAFSVDQIAFYGNPSNCPNPQVPEEPILVPTPSPTPWPTRIFTTTPTDTPWPTSTPIPIPTATPYSMFVPVLNLRPSPTPYSLPAIIPLLRPTLAPSPLPALTPKPRLKRMRIQPTPTWVWRPTKTATLRPWPTRTPILKTALPTPTRVVTNLLSLLDKEQTIEFAAPPANIYVSFGDGPGWYQLQIVDREANPVKTIYDRHVVAETEAWVEWDGRDEKGNDMPPGQYFVVIYKDGTALKSISVVRSPTAP